MDYSPFLMGLTQYGIREWKEGSNPEILKFFHAIGQTWIYEDETAWCSAFLNWCCLMTGKDYSGKLTARSWLNVGREVKNPITGDVVIFWREDKDSWKGHVGFYVKQDFHFIYVLGGNQDNEVCIKKYPKIRLLGYRRI